MEIQKIMNFEDFEKILGKSYVVIFGSAVSGYIHDKNHQIKPFLPMVKNYKEYFFSSVEKC